MATRVTSRAPARSRCRRARASAAIVGHADRVAEDRRSGAGAAAAAVEDDVVDAEVQGGVEVGLDVLGRHLDPDRDSAGALADPGRPARGRRAASSSR